MPRWTMMVRLALIGTLVVLGGAVAPGSQGAVAQSRGGPFNAFAGSWRGGGRIRLVSGESERVGCRAYYSPRSGGRSLGLAIRCASTSYRFELRASMRSRGSRVSGSWEERHFNASGSVSGRAHSGRISVAVFGSVRGHLTVSVRGRRQSVWLRASSEGNIRSLSISLRR